MSELADGSIRIGSGTTFTELIENELVQRRLPMLAEAAATIAGPQIRNVATYGGNICNGATSADSAAPTVALEAELEIAGPDGTRRIPIAGFHTGPGKVALQPAEILVALHFAPDAHPRWAPTTSNTPCGAMDIATTAAPPIARLRMVTSSACGWPTAWRPRRRCAPRTRKRQRATADPGDVGGHCRGGGADVAPRSSWRADKEFRLHLIKTLAQRVITCAVERAGGKIL